MLQYQYYNSKLTKNHIEKILSNYNIKYNTMKNEIDAKFNNMIKLFINDIKAFLENIEEISNERKKIKEAENYEVELVLLKNQLKEKNKTENQLRNELELITKENESLKKKIHSKEQIIKNKTPNFDSNNNNVKLKTEIKSIKNRYKKFTTGNNNILKNKTAKKTKEKSNININVALKSEEKRTINNYSHRSNKLLSNFGKNTSDEDNPRYNIGGFKVVPNKIGLINVINTTAPEDVEHDLDELLKWYDNLKKITIEDIIEFHYRFECIHPFGDGNGRVGRIIMFKECLKNNIIPFIVLDKDKPYYMRGLKKYKEDKMFLIDTIKHEQDLYESIVSEMLDFELDDK